MTSMTSSMTSTTVTLPTPAHSVNGSSILSEMNNDAVMGEDSPQKRKRSGDEGERDQKKVDTEGRRYGIEKLHMNMDEKYLLCRTRKAPPSLALNGIVGSGVSRWTAARWQSHAFLSLSSCRGRPRLLTLACRNVG